MHEYKKIVTCSKLIKNILGDIGYDLLFLFFVSMEYLLERGELTLLLVDSYHVVVAWAASSYHFYFASYCFLNLYKLRIKLLNYKIEKYVLYFIFKKFIISKAYKKILKIYIYNKYPIAIESILIKYRTICNAPI